MKRMIRLVALACLVGAFSGCTAEPEAPTAAALSECCEETLALVAQMPDCCRTGVANVGELSDCCATGMLDETAEAERPECCKTGKALLEQASNCCQDTILTGEVSPCCSAMPDALAAAAPQ